MKAFYKTTFTYEVLSEEPLGSVSLSDLEEMTSTGPCVGRFGPTVVKKLSGLSMAKALYDFGSEPSFFMLDDKGKVVE